MVNMDNLPDDVYKAITGKEKEKHCDPFEEKRFLQQFASSPFDVDNESLKRAAEILRRNGYKVTNKRKKR